MLQELRGRGETEGKVRISPGEAAKPGRDKRKNKNMPYGSYRIGAEGESSPNLCVHSSSSYVSPSMLPLSSGDLIEWSLVCHSTLSYQKFCDRHSNHYDHPEELHQSVE